MAASQPEVVTLVSAEGVEFPVCADLRVVALRSQRSPLQALQIDKRAACMSKAINNMLAPDSTSRQAAAIGAAAAHNLPCRCFRGSPVRQGEV
jgi:hypothetical protein